MPFRTKVKKKTLYFTKEKKEVYVITADRGGGINADKIAAFVSRETGAREAQVKMILNSIVGSIITWLAAAHVGGGVFGGDQAAALAQNTRVQHRYIHPFILRL